MRCYCQKLRAGKSSVAHARCRVAQSNLHVPRDLPVASTRFARTHISFRHTHPVVSRSPLYHDIAACVRSLYLLFDHLLTDARTEYNNYDTSFTSYGAGGGTGGGGFIPGEGGGSQQTPGGRQDHAKDTLRPVTIKQLLDAQLEPGSNDSFKIDGSTVSQACLARLTMLCRH